MLIKDNSKINDNMAFEQTFKNIDNILRTDEGCGSELDYIEQKSWILFLKYLDDLENVLTRYENGERFDEYTFSLKTPMQRALGALPVIAVVSLLITLLVLLIRSSNMKTAKKKETAFDYLSDARLTRRADIYLYTTTVRRKIETSSSSHGGGGHFSSSGGGHGSSSGGHF